MGYFQRLSPEDSRTVNCSYCSEVLMSVNKLLDAKTGYKFFHEIGIRYEFLIKLSKKLE